MSDLLGTCKTCKNYNTKHSLCDEGLWDRNEVDETWLHADTDFAEYINKDRFCTDRIAVISL
jgi:hypothetical protein